MTEPVYTVDWFTWHIPIWEGVLEQYKDLPGVQALEIGCYEGRATRWLLENVLTDPGSRITVIDVFDNQTDEYKKMGINNKSLLERFTHNVDDYMYRVRIMKGYSRDRLCELSLAGDEFDYIYVDGVHTTPGTIEDAILAWPLLKKGGIMAFDDYGWTWKPETSMDHPKQAIDFFLKIHEGEYTLVHKGYQVFIKKL